MNISGIARYSYMTSYGERERNREIHIIHKNTLERCSDNAFLFKANLYCHH